MPDKKKTLWGMQGLVNGWVKVNNKHVVFPQERPHATDERIREGQGSSEPGSNVEQQRPLSRRKSDRNVAKSEDRGGDTATTASSSLRPPAREDPESRAIRRFNTRKNSRRLQRTISHSDLLREMALSKEHTSDVKEAGRSRHVESASNTAESQSSSKQRSSESASLTVQHANQQAENDLRSQLASKGDMTTISSNSLGWMAGFFDKSADEKKSSIVLPQPHQPPQPVTTGKYLNETAFVQQYEQSKYREAKINHRSGIAGGNHATQIRQGTNENISVPHQNLKDPRSNRLRSADGSGDGSDPSRALAPPLRRGNSNVSKDDSGVSSESRKVTSQRLPLNGAPAARARMNGTDDPSQKQGFMFHPPWSGPAPRNNTSGTPIPCQSCEELDARLLALQADLEYLRSVSLRSEYVCAGCANQSSERKKKYARGNPAGVNESTALTEASQRLVEVTARHKRQIEQMTRERSRWQHDMHCKLSKFAMICKHWNEEAAVRNEEATSLESQLSATQMERNALASEVQRLRAQLEFKAKETIERQKILETVSRYEDDGLNLAEDDIRKRDAIIFDLSARLEKAINTLEKEREQQRQRRQIIFPVARTAQPSSNPVSPLEVTRLTEELEKAKEETRFSQERLNAAKAEASKNEQAWRLRCEQLERLVKQKGSMTDLGDEGDQ